jgi:hypothetical protein
MGLIGLVAVILMLFGIALFVLVKVIARAYGERAADGTIIGAIFLEFFAFLLGAGSGVSHGRVAAGIAFFILLWVAVAYIIFRILAHFMSIKKEPPLPNNCIPKLTMGKLTEFEDSSSTGFTRLEAFFKCEPKDSELYEHAHAKQMRFWGLFWKSSEACARNTIYIKCIKCKPFADPKGKVEDGGENVRVVILNPPPIYSANSVTIGVVKMYAAMGAAQVVVTAGAKYWIPMAAVFKKPLPSMPVHAQAQVSFPKADKVVKYNMGTYQWRCIAEGKKAMAKHPLSELLTVQDSEKVEEPRD